MGGIYKSTRGKLVAAFLTNGHLYGCDNPAKRREISPRKTLNDYADSLGEGWITSPKVGALALGPAPGYVLSIAVTRELLRVGVIDANQWLVAGTVRRRTRLVCRANQANARPAAWQRQLESALKQVLKEAGDVAAGQIKACAVAWPAAVAAPDRAPTFGEGGGAWGKATTVQRRLSQALAAVGLGAVPVRYFNDAAAEAVGEATYGVARDAHSTLLVKLCVGIGSAYVIDKSPLTGWSGRAGEIGHCPIAHTIPEELLRRCGCGAEPSAKHLQSVASLTAVVERFMPANDATPGYTELIPKFLEKLEETAEARRALADAGRTIATVLVPAILMINPEVVVVITVLDHDDKLFKGIAGVLNNDLDQTPKVLSGTSGTDGDHMMMRGAARLVWAEFIEPAARKHITTAGRRNGRSVATAT